MSALRELLSYYETQRSRWQGFASVQRFLLDKRGFFPTGLLYLVRKYLHGRQIQYDIKDRRVRPPINPEGIETLFVTKDIEPYPEQIAAAKAAIREGRGIVVGPTGVGKSLIAALICDEFRMKTLIVVPSLALKQQVTSGLQHFFGKDRVGPLGPKHTARHFITVENVDAVPMEPIEGIGLVIVDEFHHSGASTYRKLNKRCWNKIYYKIGLTATPFRSRDEERLLLESVLSQVIYRIPYGVAVEKGYIVPLEAYYYELPAIEMEGNPNNFGSVYSELVVNREDRNRLVAGILDNLSDAGASTLCLVKQVEHGKLIQKASGTEYPYAKGENDNNRILILEFNLREKTTLIGTMGVIGEGVDTKPAEYCVLAGGGKSKNQFMQNAGRVFRKYGDKASGKIIMIRDPSHKWLAEHFSACCDHLWQEYGVVPAQLPLPDWYQPPAKPAKTKRARRSGAE